MIKIKIINENNKLKEIFVSGHANFDIYGKDIVCASVSSIVITTINGIEKIEKDSIIVDDKKGIHIIVKKDNDIINKLLENMIDMLKELENDYKENIKFL